MIYILRSACVSLALVLAAGSSLWAQSYDRFFTDRTMRADFFHTGTKGTETISLDQIYQEGEWPGSTVNLLDTLNLGEYMVRVFDQASGALVYSRGYSCLFNEWQTTDEALGGIFRTFHETVRFPFPKQKVQFTIHRRDRQMAFHEVFSCLIDPSSSAEVNRERKSPLFPVVPLVQNGPPQKKVDILILGDGYRLQDMQKFRQDAKHFNDVMFSDSPFKERKEDFNVWTIEVASQDSGIDKPDKNIWKNSALGTQYNTFGLPRYALTTENRTIRDIAAAAPYDFVIILVNDNRYGGGGLFNLYSVAFTRPEKPGLEWQTDYVYTHEFGHCFAGLGDEYYSSAVAYNDFYQKGVEPWDPNLTVLTDRKAMRWKDLIEPGTPVPTPWAKAAYDSLERESRRLDRLAPDYNDKVAPLRKAEAELLKSNKYAGKVGAFEGAGYMEKGMYRPSVDCRMFTLSLAPFDQVCAAAIARVIDFYSH